MGGGARLSPASQLLAFKQGGGGGGGGGAAGAAGLDHGQQQQPESSGGSGPRGRLRITLCSPQQRDGAGADGGALRCQPRQGAPCEPTEDSEHGIGGGGGAAAADASMASTVLALTPASFDTTAVSAGDVSTGAVLAPFDTGEPAGVACL